MTAPTSLCVHGTCVAIDGLGLLLQGAPGCGKSDLALRLIDGGAHLIADDLTALTRRGDALFASLPEGAPAAVCGRLEVRGLGILPVPSLPEAPLRLLFDLVPVASIERLPAPEFREYAGVSLPVVRLAPFAASAAAKVRLAVRTGAGVIMRPK